MNLTKYVQEVSLEDFGRPFLHQAIWNPRLRSTGGRFFPKDGHLDFNPRILERFGWEIFRKIVRHELCHYHLYYMKKGYRHQDQDFRALLKKVDGLRYAPSVDKGNYKIYICTSCGQEFRRKQQIDLQKYRCGRCRGLLKYQGTIDPGNRP